MKRLKYLLMALVMVTCLVGSSKTVSASSYSTGKAVLPWYVQDVNESTVYSISNITDKPINVTVVFYDSDGIIVKDDNSSTSGRIVASSELINYNDQNSDSSLTFSLNAHNSGNFILNRFTSVKRGYGVIKWEQSGDELQGLVVQGARVSYDDSNKISNIFSINVNYGMPF